MPTSTGDIVSAVSQRYAGAGQFAKRYVAGKLRHDPATVALLSLAEQETLGTLVDVGCGRGQFAALLLHAKYASAVIGLDCKSAHLAEAKTAMQNLAFEARLQDFAVDQAVPDADTIMIIDALYQLPTDAQTRLLQNAARAAKRRLIIRTADPTQGLRSRLTRTLEIAFRRVWPHAGAAVNARPIDALSLILLDSGFIISVEPCWKGTPFSNVLLVARRRKEGLLF